MIGCIQPAKYEKVKNFRTVLGSCGVKNLTEYSKSTEKVKIIRQKSTLYLEYFNRGAKLKTVLKIEKTPAGFLVTAEYKDNVSKPFFLASDRFERTHIYEFAR